MIIFFREKKYIAVFLICTIVLTVLFPIKISADSELSMYSGSYALMDADTGRVLKGKNETKSMANASTTKILTCIIALENANLNEQVVVSENAAAQPKVRLGVKVGEVYPLKDMLYALMLESFNDCAVAIAEHVGGSVEEFAKLMNQKALEIGCKDTYFITPNGLDEEEDGKFHHTTAEDLCKIMSYCVWESSMKEEFLKITQTRNYSGCSNGREYSFVNRNAFLDQMEGVLSGKTGFTSKAGYCYVAAFESEGERYCIALLACGWPNNKTYKWKDAKNLLTYGADNYSKKHYEEETLLEELELNAAIGEFDFKDINQEMPLMVRGEIDAFDVLLKAGEQVEKEIILYTDEKLPIKEGQIMGVCNIYVDKTLLVEIPLIAVEESSEWTFSSIAKIIYKKFMTIF